MDPLLTAMSQVLEADNRVLREKYPDLFAKVDVLRAEPGRGEHLPPVMDDDTRYRASLRECPWCGDWFVVATPSIPTVCCSPPCGQHYSHWRRARKHAA